MANITPIEDPEEYVTIKVKRRVKELLLEMQGLLMYRDHRRYNMSDLIEYLINEAPTLEIPMSERLTILNQENQEHQRT